MTDMERILQQEKIKRNVSPEIWNSYFKFAFERNPFDKVVSDYNRRITHNNYDKSFKQYCLECSSGLMKFRNGFKLYSSKDGKIIVDFIGKYENLQDDFNFVCNKLNLSEIELKRKNVSHKNNYNYRTYYDDESKRIVEEQYSKVIKLFNYKF